MSTVLESGSLEAISTNEELFCAIAGSVADGLSMCGITAKCVGASSIPTPGSGTIAGIIGVHGTASGFVTVNAGEKLAIKIVGGLLQEKFDTLSAQIVDGMGEVTNIIAGGVKARLASSEWSFSKITVPSVIIGDSYEIAYAKGLEFLSVTFEHDDPEAIMLDDRLLRVSMSLLKI